MVMTGCYIELETGEKLKTRFVHELAAFLKANQHGEIKWLSMDAKTLHHKDMDEISDQIKRINKW